MLGSGKGAFSTLFLDLTDTWFVGAGPALATSGKTKEGLYRKKVGIVLLCDQDGFPLRWRVVEGRRHDSGPMMEMARALQSVDWARGVPLVMDRAMGATAHLEELLGIGRPFLTALSRNEFDAWTDKIPSAALGGLCWSADDALATAGEAATNAGMVRVKDDLWVEDLGVVARREDPKPDRVEVAEGSQCAERLRTARAIRAALDAGEARNLRDAGKPHGLSAAMASRSQRLLRLAPDIQESILMGEATRLTLHGLETLAWVDDFDVQRRQFAVLAAKREARFRSRLTHRLGPHSAGPLPPPDLRVRAVIAFNPEHWRRQHQTSDKKLAEIREWTRQANRRLRDPEGKATAVALADRIRERLRRDSLIDAFTVEVRDEIAAGRALQRIDVEPDAVEWPRRKRFHGFQIIVASPEESRSSATLVASYRSKDAIEKDFQTIKSVLRLRPVRHRTDPKVRAHVTLCMLSLLVERDLERQLKGKMSAATAFETLAEVHLNRLRLGDCPVPMYTLTRVTPQHAEILKSLALEPLSNAMEVTTAIQPR